MDFRAQVLLSVQRALWGVITPDVRAVAVGWGDHVVHVRFVYDHPVGEEEDEVVADVETEVLADLEPDVMTVFTAAFDDSPVVSRLPEEGWWAYLRREA